MFTIYDVLKYSQHNLDIGNEEDVKRATKLRDYILSKGVDEGKVAERYLATVKSDFFSISHLQKCVKEELGEDLPTKEEAWIQVTENIGKHSRDDLPPFIPLIVKAVKSLGGWRYLSGDTNLAVERSNFFRIYESLREEELVNRLLNG